MRPAENINESIRRLHVKASDNLDKRVHGDISKALAESKKTKPVWPSVIWRTIMKTKTVKFAAAAVIVLAVVGGMTFWPGSSPDGKKWWLGPPAVWGQEIMAELDATKAVTYREQIVRVMPDGSEQTTGTWDVLFDSSNSYRRDIYYKDVLIETQWYVSDGDGMLQYSVRFDLKSYFTSSHGGSYVNSDPVERMRFYVGLIGKADKLLGEKIIDGVNCVGFEIIASKYGDNPEERVDCIWFDIETKLPVRIEHHGISVSVAGHADMTMTIIQDQFDYDPGLSADTFVPYTPEGFVFGHPDDIQAARERQQK